jgi:hypothetical protein
MAGVPIWPPALKPFARSIEDDEWRVWW